MQAPLPNPLPLRAGDLQRVRLDAGTLVVVEDADLILEGPVCWLGERTHTPRTRIMAGSGHWVEVAGWVSLSCAPQTRDDCVARVRLVPPASGGERLASQLRAGLNALSQVEDRLLALALRALQPRARARGR